MLGFFISDVTIVEIEINSEMITVYCSISIPHFGRSDISICMQVPRNVTALLTRQLKLSSD